jgi:hypothetical protein
MSCLDTLQQTEICANDVISDSTKINLSWWYLMRDVQIFFRKAGFSRIGTAGTATFAPNNDGVLDLYHPCKLIFLCTRLKPRQQPSESSNQPRKSKESPNTSSKCFSSSKV